MIVHWKERHRSCGERPERLAHAPTQTHQKEYKTGDLIQKALDDVSLNLRDNEFVAILGPSGSGKTTLLNIIGGLDRYDSGDLIINGVSTKNTPTATGTPIATTPLVLCSRATI